MYKGIGLIIKYHRKRQRLSQAALAEGICVPSYLSKIEHGEVVPTDALIGDLASKLHIDLHHMHLENDIVKCEKAMSLIVNLRVKEAKELYHEITSDLSLSDKYLEYFTLKYYFEDDLVSKEILLSTLDDLDDQKTYMIGLLIYDKDPSLTKLLSKYFIYCGFGYYLKGVSLHRNKSYRKALSMFEESELQYLKEGRLNGIFHSIKYQGIALAMTQQYELSEMSFKRLLDMIGDVGHEYVKVLIRQTNYNLNYMRHLQEKPNQLKKLLMKNIENKNYSDSTMFYTLGSMYCRENKSLAIEILEEGLSEFSDEGFDNLQLNIELRKIKEPEYMKSEAYYYDLKMIINFLFNSKQYLEYNVRVSEMIHYLKSVRRYKEALDLVEGYNNE